MAEANWYRGSNSTAGVYAHTQAGDFARQGQVFADAFVKRASAYVSVVDNAAAEKHGVSRDPERSDLGKRQAWQRIEIAAAREIGRLRDQDLAGLDAHIASVREAAARKQPTSEIGQLFAFEQAREVLADLMEEDPVFLAARLQDAAIDDAAWRVIDDPILSFRLTRHLDRKGLGKTFNVDTARAARAERLSPEIAGLQALRQAYASLAANALKDIAAPADGSAAGLALQARTD